MTKRFRLPCKMALYIGEGRPAKPNWMLNPKYATRNQFRSWDYWCLIWQRTPACTDQEMVAQLKAIYESAKDNEEVDHIVPLKHPLVSGLHVPNNLEPIDKKENQKKSNNHWPDMPIQQLDIFNN